MAYIEDVVIVNKNHCRSHGLALTTALTNLTGGHACSEMYIVNKTGNPVIVYDNAFVATDQGFLLDDNDSVTVLQRILSPLRQLQEQVFFTTEHSIIVCHFKTDNLKGSE